MSEHIFTVGGTVQASNGLYIPRRADDELLALCRAGSFAYVLTPRQLGKSSLMVRTAEQLTAQGVRSVIVDLSQIGVQVTPEEWYLGLLSMIEEQLDLETNAVTWWRERAHLGVTQRLTLFLEEVLLSEVDAPVVVFVDEIDTTLSLTFTDDFFAAIRYFYNARALSKDVRRLSFVLIGVATPGDLIRDPQRTPFNIGQRVDLTDFTLEEALPLATGFGLPDDEARKVLGRVMKWTGGHPYLTQRLCRALTDSAPANWSEAEVDEVVSKTFFGKISEQDNNLQFVRDMLTKRAPDLSDVLYTYREVLRQTRRVQDEEQSLVKSHLKLSGVAQRRHGELTVRNPIYAEVFNEKWIKEHLPVNWFKRARRAGVPLAFALVLAAAVFLGFSAVAANRKVDSANQFVEAERKRANDLTASAQRERDRATQLSAMADQARKRAEVSLLEAQASAKKADEAKRETQRAFESARQSGLLAAARGKESELARREAEEQQRMATANLLASKAKLLSTSEASLLPESALLALEALRLSPTSDVEVLHHVEEVLPVQLTALEHEAGVEAVAFSPDGNYLATGSRDSTAQLWKVGGSVIRLKHSNQVLALAFSPDSKYLATASVDMINVWDTATGKVSASFDVPTTGPAPGGRPSVSFSPDGKYLASAEGARVMIREWQTKTIVNELTHDATISQLAFSASGKYLATSSGTYQTTPEGNFKSSVWDWKAGKEIISEKHQREVSSIAFSRDGSHFAVGTGDGAAEIWETASGTRSSYMLHDQAVLDVTFSPNGQYLATASADKTARVWDVSTGRPIKTLQHPGAVKRVRFDSDGTYLATTSDDGATRLWQWELERVVAVMPQQFGANEVAFSPNGQFLASAGEDNVARVWKFTSAQLLRGGMSQTLGLAFSPNSKLVASITDSHNLQVRENPSGSQIARWEIALRDPLENFFGEAKLAFIPDGERVAVVRKFDDAVKMVDIRTGRETKAIIFATHPSTVVLSGNGKYVAAALNTGKNNMHVWDLATGKEVAYFEPNLPYSISFSANGEYLAVGTYESTVELWNVASGAKETEFDVKNIPGHIACSPDGRYVVVDRKDDPFAISIWETGSKTEIATVKHNDSINYVEFSPDGKYLATASRDRTARIWDVVTGAELSRVSYDKPVLAITFSPDERYLATATSDGIIHTWFRRPEELGDLICNRLIRNLTQEEWTRYVGKIPYQKTCPNLP
jgi:WD40 repeat protein